MDVPPYVKPGEIAKACGISWKKAIGKMRRAGLLEHDGAHRYEVDTTKLREKLRPIYVRLVTYFDRHAPD